MSDFRAIPFSKAKSNNSVNTSSSSSLTSSSSSPTLSPILTPPSEPFIKGILIKNSNVVDGINIGNNNSLPLTPPDYTTLFQKRTVSFNIPEDNKNFHNTNKSISFADFDECDDDVEMSIEDDGNNDSDEYDTLAENFNSIDISAKLLNNSDEIQICVALLERDTEMKELFIINKDYFDGVKQFISDNNGSTRNTWQEFLNLLYSKREVIPDKRWMKCIENHLKENPLFLVKFKEIVGYYDDYDDDDVIDDTLADNDNIYHDNAYLEQFYKDNYYYQNNNFIDVTLIRDFPKILENFESSYPQFFINLKQTLDKKSTNNNNNSSSSSSNSSDEQEEKTSYEKFKNILLKSRNEMTDIEWEESIYNILNPYPRLIEQFEEIIAYEISEE